jgi:YVTN family beta-propeller protein
LVYNPTNNKVYCANWDSDNVTVIDGATNAVITTIAVGSWPCALVYNPTNNKVYCANCGSDNVTVIDAATNAVITTIGVGDEPWAFTWNYAQNRTYVANYVSSSVSVIRDVTGIEEDNFAPVERDIFTTTLFSGPLQLPEGKECKVFDITGRVVEPTKITRGIYFIEIDGVVTQKVVKVR